MSDPRSRLVVQVVTRRLGEVAGRLAGAGLDCGAGAGLHQLSSKGGLSLQQSRTGLAVLLQLGLITSQERGYTVDTEAVLGTLGWPARHQTLTSSTQL